MNAESDYNIKKDAKRLYTIMLTKNEWQILEQLINLLAPFAKATTLLGNYQIESESDNINFDDITTIFDEEKIIVDYDYDNEIEITIDAKEINVNESIETKGLVYKVKNALYEALKYYWKLPLESSLIATFLDPR
ncbi:19986_t:CDS:2, partial [Racocetra persica]